jgi:hypothetical protein
MNKHVQDRGTLPARSLGEGVAVHPAGPSVDTCTTAEIAEALPSVTD